MDVKRQTIMWNIVLSIILLWQALSRGTAISTILLVRQEHTQTSLRIRAVWSESSLAVWRWSITKTCLYNFDPIKLHFYIVKLGFTGVYIIFLFLLKNIDCGYSLEPPLRGGSNEYPQSMFWAEIWKISEFFYLKKFSFWKWNFLYIWIGVFS